MVPVSWRNKAVADSVAHPEIYSCNNIVGIVNLYDVMKQLGCNKVQSITLKPSRNYTHSSGMGF
jgi:UDP-glucose 4-epimerase